MATTEDDIWLVKVEVLQLVRAEDAAAALNVVRDALERAGFYPDPCGDEFVTESEPVDETAVFDPRVIRTPRTLPHPFD